MEESDLLIKAAENWQLVFLVYLKYFWKLDKRVTRMELLEEFKKEAKENA